jgi:hypothetical protein
VKFKKSVSRSLSVLLLAVLTSGLSSPLVFAATLNSNPTPSATANPDGAFNIVVSPPSIGLQTKPGVPVSTDIKIQNQGLSTEHVKITVMKFGAHGQDGTPDLIDLKPTDEYASWATFSSTHFDAEPNVYKTIKMTINPPASAAFGYYYAVVFSRDGAEQQIKKKQANLLGAVASLVLLDVQAPGAIRQAKISEFSTARKTQEFLPEDFTVRMQNTGNTHVAPRGNIIISRNGKQVALLEVNLSKGYVLPGSSRKFTATWADGTPVYIQKVVDGKVVLDKSGKPVMDLNWDKFSVGKLRFGKYDAKLVMVYDDGKGDVSTEASLSFWVIPWRIIGIGAVVGLLVLAGLWATFLRPVRNRIKHKNNRGYDARHH